MIKKHNIFKSSRRIISAKRVVLHHTAGSTLKGAEDTLVKRGLGYHYMIDKNGETYEYVPPNRRCSHAYRNNTGTVGVAYVGGGVYGAINAAQYLSLVNLLRYLNSNYEKIESFTGHKHIDPRGWKIDPRWPGEPKDGVNLDIDRKYMLELESKVGLKAEFSKRRKKK